MPNAMPYIVDTNEVLDYRSYSLQTSNDVSTPLFTDAVSDVACIAPSGVCRVGYVLRRPIRFHYDKLPNYRLMPVASNPWENQKPHLIQCFLRPRNLHPQSGPRAAFFKFCMSRAR